MVRIVQGDRKQIFVIILQCKWSWVSDSSGLAMVLGPPTLELLSALRRLPDPGLLVDPDRLLDAGVKRDIVLMGCLLLE